MTQHRLAFRASMLVALAGLAVGCDSSTQRVTKGDSADSSSTMVPTSDWLVGNWTIQSGFGPGYAEFKSDGSYTRQLRSNPPHRSLKKDEGTWKLKDATIVLTVEWPVPDDTRSRHHRRHFRWHCSHES